VLAWLEEALSYYQQERDLRGYVAGKGWAQAVAHGADLLLAFASHRFIQVTELERILQIIGWRISSPASSILLDQADERLALVVLMALQRNVLPLSWLRAWVQGLLQPQGCPSWEEAYRDQQSNIALMHLRTSLRSLYFQLLLTKHPRACGAALCEEIAQALRALDFGFYQ
jgi:hypothetical protein